MRFRTEACPNVDAAFHADHGHGFHLTNMARCGHVSMHLKHLMHLIVSMGPCIGDMPLGHSLPHLLQSLQVSKCIADTKDRLPMATSPLNDPTGQRHFQPFSKKNPRARGTTRSTSSQRRGVMLAEFDQAS